MLTKLRTLLGSDRGDSDPVLVIVSMFVSALVAATVIGSLSLVIQLGTNFVREQVQATTLSQVQKMWAQDANNASDVEVFGSSRVVFYERQDRSPGVHLDRGRATDPAFEPLTGCRKSTWVVSGDRVTNLVERWTDNIDCDLDGDTATVVDPVGSVADDSCYWATGRTDRTTGCTMIDGLTGGARVEAANAAGRTLVFDADGGEVGDRARPVGVEWWTDTEWVNPAPRVVNLVAEFDFPISGTVDGSLYGTTWIGPSTAGDQVCEGCPAEVEPELVVHDPGQLVLHSITRSSSLGATPTGVGSSREGLNVAFTGIGCGIYSTEYTVLVEPDTASRGNGAPLREATWTSFDLEQSRDIDRVPNGTRGQVTVHASCPASVPTVPVVPVTGGYEQDLPAPIVETATVVAPHEHVLGWTPVSTLPVTYTVQADIGSSGWDDLGTGALETTSHTVVWPVGSAYGQDYRYRVTGEAGHTGMTSPPSVPAGPLHTAWPAIAAPTLTGESVEPLRFQVTVDGITCPTGTVDQYRQRVQFNGNGWETWSVWATGASTVVHEFLEGRHGQFQGQARCAYIDPNTGHTRTSPISETSTGLTNTPTPGPGTQVPPGEWVEPITTRPGTPTLTPANDNTRTDPAPPAPVSWAGATGCPTETHPEYRWRHAVDGAELGDWTDWVDSRHRVTDHAVMNFGALLNHHIQARCATDWGTTPLAVGPETNGHPGSWVRQIPAPDPAQNLRHDAGGTSAPVNNRILWDPVTCWTGTTVAYEPEHHGHGRTGWQTHTQFNVNTGWGTRYEYRVLTRCSSAHTHSPEAGSTYTSWTTNVPTPATPVMTITPNPVSTGQTFTVATSNTCPTGTSPRYDVWTTGSTTRWGTGTFTDWWPRWSNNADQRNHNYHAQIWCAGPDAQGNRSGTATAQVRVVQPALPPPAAPSSLWADSRGVLRHCTGGFDVQMFWSPSSGATSYQVQYEYNTGSGAPSIKTASTSDTSYHAFESPAVTTVGFSFRVRALGPGGTSGWTGWQSVKQFPGCV